MIAQSPRPSRSFAFGIVTALPKEFAAMLAMLDDVRLFEVPGDPNDYAEGSVAANDDSGATDVVLTLLKKPGNNSAGVAASHLLRSFPDVGGVLMVGIAGGVPHPTNPEKHVRLGDVVVSNEHGVFQWDNVKREPSGDEYRDSSASPSASLIGKCRLLEAKRIAGERPWEAMIARGAHLEGAQRPDVATDVLHDSADPTTQLPHPLDHHRPSNGPRIHYGRIGSANVLLKDPRTRDHLRDEFGVRAIEMEGSGIADGTWIAKQSYILIRGISDYCDQHKNDVWQGYAAVAASAYARALIASFPAQRRSERVHAERLRDLLHRAKEAHEVGDYAEANRLATQATDLLSADDEDELAWEAWQARWLPAVDVAQQNLCDLDPLEHFLVRMEEIARRAPKNYRLQVGTRIHRASWAMETQRFRMADLALAEARALADESGKDTLREVALIQSGRHFARAGMAAELRDVIAAGESLRTEVGPWADLDAALAVLVDDAEQADAAFWRAIMSTGKGRLVPEAYTHRCDAAEYMNGNGLHERAIRFCEFAQSDSQLPPNDRLALRLSIAEAKARLASGQPVQAETILRRVMHHTEVRFPYFRGMALFGLASIAVDRGDYPSAREAAGLAVEAFLAANAIAMAAKVTAFLANSWVDESPATAEKHYGAAIQLASSMGDAGDSLATHLKVQLVCHAQFAGRSNADFIPLVEEAQQLDGLTAEEQELLATVRGIATSSASVARAIKDLAEVGEAAGQPGHASVGDRLAGRVIPLLAWHGHYPAAPIPEVLLDAWGRGSFSAVAADLRRDTLASKLTVSVSTVDDVRRAVRMLAPFADCLVLIWRGALDARFERELLVPGPWLAEGGPPVGHGYGVWRDIGPQTSPQDVARVTTMLDRSGALRKPPLSAAEDLGLLPAEATSADFLSRSVEWFSAGGYGNYLPRDVAQQFLVELRPLVELGRVILLPGDLVGCPAADHDSFERSFHEALGAWAVDGATGADQAERNATTLCVPWFPEIRLEDLASLIVDEQESLNELRTLIWQHGVTASQGGPDGIEAARREFRERARSGFDRIQIRFRRLEQRLSDSLGPVTAHEMLGVPSAASTRARFIAEPAPRTMSELAALSHQDPWYWVWRARGLSSRLEIDGVRVRGRAGPSSRRDDRNDAKMYLSAHWLMPAVPGWSIRRRLRV